MEEIEAKIKNYLEAIALSPNQAELYHKLGEIFSQQEKWKEAVDAYCQAVKINPNFSWAYHKLGEALTQLGCHREAVEAYKIAIKLKPEFPWSYHKLGEILMELENWDEAILAYRQFIEINPDFPVAYHKLGDACQEKGLLDEAVSCYNRVLEKTPDSAVVQKKLGEVLQKLGRPQEAINCYQELIKLQPNNWGVYSMLGQCLVEVGEFEEAIAAFNHAIKLNSNMPWCYANLGNALEKLQKLDEAVIAYRRAFACDPENNFLAKKLAFILKKLALKDELKYLYQTLIKNQPNNWLNYTELAAIYIQEENWEEALDCSIQILQIQPDHNPTYFAIGELLKKQGQLKAAKFWKKSFKLPQNVLEKNCQLTVDFQVKSKLATDIIYQEIYPETQIKLLKSCTISKQPKRYFKAKNFQLPEAFVAVLPEARAWADLRNSVVITSDNKLVEDLYTGCGELVFCSNKLPPFQYIDGNVAFLSVKHGHVYYHWMFDIIPRFYLLNSSGIKLSEIDYFVVNKCKNNFQIATLKKLGIPQEKILESSRLHIKAKKLIVPALITGGRGGFWACDFLKSKFLTDAQEIKKGAERIYISRKLASRRRVINEEEVVKFLEKLGFVSVNLESMSLEEQARCLRAAKVVIAPHGAGLTNLVFCNPGTKAIEFFPPEYVAGCYWQLSNVCGLEHYYLIGEYFDDDSQPFPNSRNILINLKKLSKLMKKAAIF